MAINSDNVISRVSNVILGGTKNARRGMPIQLGEVSEAGKFVVAAPRTNAVDMIHVGICEIDAEVGEVVTVVTHGETLGIAGVTGWTAGEPIQPDASGTMTGAMSANSQYVAVALETVAAGETGRVWVWPTSHIKT
jgi:hypothetical protein